MVTNDSVTVGSSSTMILSKKETRLTATIINDSDENIYLSLGEAAVMNKGIRINANGGSYEINTLNPYRDTVYGICSSGSKNVTIMDN